VSGALHVSQRHDGHQASNVQARCRGVKPDVPGDLMFLEMIAQLLLMRGLLDEPALPQNVD
jgi:hypothetical protein